MYMKTIQNNRGSSNSKIGQHLFITMLVIQVLFASFIGFSMLFLPHLILVNGFNLSYNPSMQNLTIVIGMQVLFSVVVAILSIVWIRRQNIYGFYLGTFIGIYKVSFGVVSFLFTQTIDGLLVDSTRGILTLIFAYFAFKELKKINR